MPKMCLAARYKIRKSYGYFSINIKFAKKIPISHSYYIHLFYRQAIQPQLKHRKQNRCANEQYAKFQSYPHQKYIEQCAYREQDQCVWLR